MFPIGTKVTVSCGCCDSKGEVVGHGTFKRDEKVHPAYLIQIDKGLWAKDYREMWIDIIVAHPDNVERLS